MTRSHRLICRLAWSLGLFATATLPGSVKAAEQGPCGVLVASFTLDGGGITQSSGGVFSLGATIGQVDAGRMTGGDEMTGVEFTLTGGFWRPRTQACVAQTTCDDFDVCTWDQWDGVSCQNSPNRYGDVDHNGFVTLADMFCVMRAFGGDFCRCTLTDGDISPCGGDCHITLADLLAILKGYEGNDLCCGW